MDLLEFDDLIDKEYAIKAELSNNEINKIITTLKMYSEDVEMLTQTYTNILLDDNVMYILTRISQSPVFRDHFPEFYIKNKYGENVINCQQNTMYHRYGVFKHTLCTVENVGKDSLKFNAQELKILKWAMFLHDIGKPQAKMINGSGADSFAGHEDISEAMAAEILERFKFSTNEKKLILTLIKYHDKYLNEGDLTYDNLSFLAKELQDRKDLFYLLIEVKCADNKAKSIDVYNKFINIQNKYYEFASDYFNSEMDGQIFDSEQINDTEIIDDEVDTELLKEHEVIEPSETYEEGGSTQEITEKTIVGLCKDVTAGRRLKCYYQPVVDVVDKEVEGYEVYYKIITDENFSYKQIIKKAKEFEKYDKLQQMLFINSLNRFKELQPAANLTEYINIDARSYKNYVNKSRIFDVLAGKNIVIDFNNFEMLNNTELKEIIFELHKAKIKVCIDNFESSNKGIDDIEEIEPKVVKYNLEKLDENTKKEIKQLVAFCTAQNIMFIVFGVETKEELNFAMDAGVRYIQGEYFSKPIEGLHMTKKDVIELLADAEDEMIV